MKRLKILILIFCLAISLPLAYVVWQTYQSLAQEEHAQLRFFSEALFDEMEKDLYELVFREENRAVDEYHFTLAQGKDGIQSSPLALPPEEEFILGYLQNNAILVSVGGVTGTISRSLTRASPPRISTVVLC